MSKAACKQQICNSNITATLGDVDQLADSGEFTDDELLDLAAVMDKANKRIQKIAFGDDDG